MQLPNPHKIRGENPNASAIGNSIRALSMTPICRVSERIDYRQFLADEHFMLLLPASKVTNVFLFRINVDVLDVDPLTLNSGGISL
jgi:hypothetical protein